jgi:hypothetical protein
MHFFAGTQSRDDCGSDFRVLVLKSLSRKQRFSYVTTSFRAGRLLETSFLLLTSSCLHIDGLHIDNPVVWGETPLQTLISKLNCFKLSFLICLHGASPHAGAGALDA